MRPVLMSARLGLCTLVAAGCASLEVLKFRSSRARLMAFDHCRYSPIDDSDHLRT
jgi:hypothetical protein